jgi:uncharacterized protein YndB with AHSA1/START domain
MPNKFVATKSIRIKAPISRVWDALTDPALIKQYFFGSQTTTDWKVGSPIRFHGEWEGKPYEDKGTILAIEKNKLIKYSYWSSFSGIPDIPENYNNIIYRLQEEDGEVVYTVLQEGIRDEQTRDHSEANWGVVMTQMKKLLEEGKIN